MKTPIKTEKVNTNNGWGFNGWSGEKSTYDNGLIECKGKWSSRHQGTSPYYDFRILDKDGNELPIENESKYPSYKKAIVFFFDKWRPILLYEFKEDSDMKELSKQAIADALILAKYYEKLEIIETKIIEL